MYRKKGLLIRKQINQYVIHMFALKALIMIKFVQPFPLPLPKLHLYL